MFDRVIKNRVQGHSSLRRNTTRIAILVFINSPIILIWFAAGFGDHGQGSLTVYLTIGLTFFMLSGAIIALLRKKDKLALLLGLASPTILVAYIVFGLALGALIRMQS